MELLVREYLRTHSFRQLEEEHGVAARPNSLHDKFSLNYDMVTAKPGDRVSEQCRGLVLRPVDAIPVKGWEDAIVGYTEVLAWPMERFYNHGDVNAAAIDWSDKGLRVYEKLDGTMIVVYWDELHSKWYAATRAVPEADHPMNGDLDPMTFSDLFMLALRKTRENAEGRVLPWAKCSLCGVSHDEAAHPDLPCPKDDVTPHDWSVVDGYDKIVHLNKELTYVFELTSPKNRVVVRYEVPRVTLLAVRHTQTGREFDIETIRLEHVQRPLTWDFKNVSSLEAFVDNADPAKLEGAVVCDSRFRRLKVKNKTWIMSSRAKDMVMVSQRSAMRVVVSGKLDDVLPLLEPAIAEKLVTMNEQAHAYFASVDKRFAALYADAGNNRKHFAEQVLLSGDWHTPYFIMLDKKAGSTFQWLQKLYTSQKLTDGTLDIILSRMVVSTV